MNETTTNLETAGTELYRRTMAAEYPSADIAELMKSEWTPTPWMVDAVTDRRDMEMRSWCHRQFGRESSPMHGQEGSWRRASVTMHGRTWLGFKTKEFLERFLAAFPEPPTSPAEIVPWPTDEGLWMGNVSAVGWFPFYTKGLEDDLPSREQMRLEKESPETAPPRTILCIVAQWLESDKSWPFLFKSNHPAKEWRRPTEDEECRAKVFYGK